MFLGDSNQSRFYDSIVALLQVNLKTSQTLNMYSVYGLVSSKVTIYELVFLVSHTHTHTHTYAHTHTHSHTHTHTHTHTYTHTHTLSSLLRFKSVMILWFRLSNMQLNNSTINTLKYTHIHAHANTHAHSHHKRNTRTQTNTYIKHV